MDEAECKAEFRVDLPALADALRIPVFVMNHRSVAGGMEGLCMLVKRLAYPCRHGDMVPRFGRTIPVISMITKHALDFIYDTHAYLLTRWNNGLLNRQSLEVYADAIHGRGAALQNWFVDGTVRPIARPGEQQRAVYNGHKRVHALKFQSVAPDQNNCKPVWPSW